MFEKDLSLSVLFDIYSPLLSEKKKNVFEEYYLDDLSLSEIAGETGTTRQAVRDLIARTSEELENYESALGLLKKQKEILPLLESLKDCSDRAERERFAERIKELL